jgi:hypothetical protein
MSATRSGPESRPIGVNRRQALRARLMAQVESHAPAGTSIGHAENVSEGGLLVLTRDTFPAETEVTVRFNLPPVPPGRPVECQGVVLRAEDAASMAIEFRDVKDDDRQALEAYVRQTRANG